MKCNLAKVFVALILGMLLFNIVPNLIPAGVFGVGGNYTESFARLFQLLFFLFIISPPLIVVMLYLIWQELKNRNKMK